MAGILTPISELLTRLSQLAVVNGDGESAGLYTRVWNNQIRYEEDGKLYIYPKPAAFVEIVSPVQFKVIGQGYRAADLAIRIHLSHEDYNTEGSFEQDLRIFALRDAVVGWLTGWKLTGCSTLTSIGEDQDYSHANVYHYILDFVCNFTDTKGSRLDPDKWDKFIETEPPTEYEADLEIKNNTGGQLPGIGAYIVKGV